MNGFNDLKNWPDKKKRVFSIILAAVITLIIVGTWIVLRPKVKIDDEINNENNKAAQSIKESIDEISEKFSEMKGQFFGATSTNTIEATTSGTTTE